jgi:hypothetical protein
VNISQDTNVVHLTLHASRLNGTSDFKDTLFVVSVTRKRFVPTLVRPGASPPDNYQTWTFAFTGEQLAAQDSLYEIENVLATRTVNAGGTEAHNDSTEITVLWRGLHSDANLYWVRVENDASYQFHHLNMNERNARFHDAANGSK